MPSSGFDVSYSSLKFKPYLLSLYSNPPNNAAFPVNQLVELNAPPSPPVFPPLVLKESFRKEIGLEILPSEPNRPQPIPAVISQLSCCFVATIYSEENLPVPAMSLSPKAIAGVN